MLVFQGKIRGINAIFFGENAGEIIAARVISVTENARISRENSGNYRGIFGENAREIVPARAFSVTKNARISRENMRN